MTDSKLAALIDEALFLDRAIADHEARLKTIKTDLIAAATARPQPLALLLSCQRAPDARQVLPAGQAGRQASPRLHKTGEAFGGVQSSEQTNQPTERAAQASPAHSGWKCRCILVASGRLTCWAGRKALWPCLSIEKGA